MVAFMVAQVGGRVGGARAGDHLLDGSAAEALVQGV